jgi:hypothetical protein
VATYLKFKDKGLHALATFDNIIRPWVARDGLDPTLVEAIRKTLLSLKDKQALKAISKDVTGFRLGDDELYDFVRKGMRKARSSRRATSKPPAGSRRSSRAGKLHCRGSS